MKRIAPNREIDYKIPSEINLSRDARLKKLKSRLRTHVRRLRFWPLLSKSWLIMTESINQIAEVAFMEMNLPFNMNKDLRSHIGRKKQGTLWDQEEDELAIAIMQEEGKVNLCISLLCEYSQVMHDEEQTYRMISEAAARVGEDRESISESVMLFEKGVGIIINLAMTHVEVLQILDIGTLVQHLANVFENASCRKYLWEHKQSAEFRTEFLGVDKLQEFQVIHYLASIIKHLEEIDEEKIMDMMEQHNMIAKATKHVVAYMDWFSNDVFASYLLFLNGCFDCETYLAEKSRFIAPAVKKVCMNLTEKFMKPTLKSTFLISKHVASFTKELEIWKREEKLENSG